MINISKAFSLILAFVLASGSRAEEQPAAKPALHAPVPGEDDGVPPEAKQAFRVMFPTIKVERYEKVKADAPDIYRFWYHIDGWEFKTVFKGTRWTKTFKYVTAAELTPAVAKAVATSYPGRKMTGVSLRSTPARGPVYVIAFGDYEAVLSYDGKQVAEHNP